jgi:UDP-N-acetylmuramoyl-tripeptide--D-alanyl-D-alanine ligase
MIVTLAIAVAFGVWRIARRTYFFLHLLQLEGYRTGAFTGWLAGHMFDAVLRRSHLLGGFILVVLFFLGNEIDGQILTWVPLLWAVCFASSKRYRRDDRKKPLVFTPRLNRIIALSLIAVSLSVALIVAFPVDSATSLARFLAVLFGVDLLSPLIVVSASFLLSPVEAIIRNGFKRRARKTLKTRSDLETIAITGSYGKTSIKFAVRDVLSFRYSVLATPGSFNTPMGICKVVNNDLNAGHRFLVLEMGIRYPGDIAELCDIARPDIAIISSVGVAHLESMGGIEAIAEEKASLLRFVREKGHAILNVDDPRVAAMASDFAGTVWRISTHPSQPSEISASEIRFGPDGARFSVRDELGNECDFNSRLLGRHNISNILMAIAAGRIHGLRLRQMRHAVEQMAPVPHRLALREEAGIHIIDDAFNSNPVGARNAIEILSRFTSGRRVVVTPGMIELGALQDSENERFGACMVGSVDLVILVGEHQTSPIREGLQNGGFDADRIVTVRSLFEARSYLKGWLRPGDTVLYENDLPDQFNEA